MIYNELCYKNRTLIIRKDDIVQINYRIDVESWSSQF